MKITEILVNLLFPPKCPCCGKLQSRPCICPACEGKLSRTAGKDILRTGPGGLRCAAPLWYEGAGREALLRLKFQGMASAAEPLGEWLARCAAQEFGGEFDTVTWVPVSRRRLRGRGYDQARLLAQAACRLWGVKPVRLLKKTADNQPQSGLRDEAARRANVLGVYEAVSPEKIAGRRILLVDDICTTGATLTECIRVLKDAGAADVVCAAVAHTRERTHEKSKSSQK